MAFSSTIQSNAVHSASAPVASPRVIEIHSTSQALRAIEGDWRQLEIENTGKTTVFQSFDWAMAWCQAYMNAKTKTELFIITGKINNKISFILPLAKNYKHGLSILDWLTDPVGQYGDVLCSQNQSAQIWLQSAFQHIAKTKGIDLVRLRHVRANGNVEYFANQNLQNAKCYERAPYLDLTSFKSETEYDARYTSTQRKRRKKIRKALEEIGPVVFKAATEGLEADTLIEVSIAEKNAWLSDRGRFNRIMGCPSHIKFLKLLSRMKSDSFGFCATELSAGGKPVSWEIAFRYHGTHFAYITSHLNALTDLSPGRLHMDLSQRKALADRQKTFDLMVPYDAHKDSWSSAYIPTNDYYMPISILGRIYGFAYLRTLRPALRKIYYNLPQQVLRFLQPLTRH